MKVLLYSLIFPPDTCSNSFVFADLTKGLIKEGDEVAVITTTPHYDEEHALCKKEMLQRGQRVWYRKSIYKGANVFHIDVSTSKGGFFQRLRTFYRFHHFAKQILKIEKINANLVIAQTPPMTIGIDLLSLSRRLKAKSVLVLQDLWLDAMVDAGRIKGVLKFLLRLIEKYEYRKVSVVTTIDQSMADRVYDICAVLPQVIPNFVDTELYFPQEADASVYAKYGLSPDDFIISYVGNIGEAQDLTPLMSYAAHNDRSKIIIAGNGVKEKEYREYVRNNNLKNVIFTGYVSREDAAEINSISVVCTVLLAEHVLATSFPSKLYSIMAMKKPVFICCMPDNSAGKFVEENMIGWHSAPTDIEQINATLDYISLNRDEAKKKGEKALQLIKRDYNLESIVNRYRALIK